jgi:hypothetical protein
MARTHPALESAAAVLKVSIDTIVYDNTTKLSEWTGIKKAILAEIREDHAMQAAAARSEPDKEVAARVATAEVGSQGFSLASRSGAYIIFLDVLTEARALNKKIDVLKNYRRTLDAMVVAHASLISANDSGLALNDFLGIVTDLGGLAAAAKPSGT